MPNAELVTIEGQPVEPLLGYYCHISRDNKRYDLAITELGTDDRGVVYLVAWLNAPAGGKCLSVHADATPVSIYQNWWIGPTEPYKEAARVLVARLQGRRA